MTNISLDVFRAYAKSNENARTDSVVHLTHRQTGTLESHNWVRLGQRSDTFKARNLATRDAFLKAVLNHYRKSSARDLPPAVLKALNIGKFDLDSNGRVMSEKPLTLRRIKRVLTAINADAAAKGNDIHTELTGKWHAALDAITTNAFKDEISERLNDLNELKPDNKDDFKQQAVAKTQDLLKCLRTHLSNDNFRNLIAYGTIANDQQFWIDVAVKIYEGIKDRLQNLPLNGQTAGAIFSELSRQTQEAGNIREERQSSGDLLSPPEFADEIMTDHQRLVLLTLVSVLSDPIAMRGVQQPA